VSFSERSGLWHDEKRDELWSRVAQGLTTNEIRFPSVFGIAGSVLHSLETINIADAYEDDRFNQDVDKKTGYHTTSILCMPVVNKRGKAIGVAQVLNKAGGPFKALFNLRCIRAIRPSKSVNSQLILVVPVYHVYI
jgi:adenylate cyclase